MKYSYRPLDSARCEIRLLRLRPAATLDAPLRIQLFHTSLDGEPAPAYEALSYVWGEPWGRFSVTVEENDRKENDTGKAFILMTPNLDTVLRHLRYHGIMDRVLWVDALCINQDDAAERSRQVQLMRRIYESCKADIAWIGPSPMRPDTTGEEGEAGEDEAAIQLTPVTSLAYQDSPIAVTMRAGLQLMRQLATRDVHTLSALTVLWDQELLDAEAKNGTEANASTANRLDPRHKRLLDYDQMRSLRRAFSRAMLWKRVWVVQELACAPRVLLAVGRHAGEEEGEGGNGDRLDTLDWDQHLVGGFLDDGDFADAFHSAWGHGQMTPILSGVFSRVREIQLQRRRMQGRAPAASPSLIDVLARFKGARSTDPRDKVYGLLGLVEADPAADGEGLTVDYAKPAALVFEDAALAILRASRCLDLLTQNPFQGSDQSQQELGADGMPVDAGSGARDALLPAWGSSPRVRNLPSWVPNFDRSAYRDYEDELSAILFAQRGIYAAGRAQIGQEVSLVAEAASMTGRPTRGLRLRGAVIGRLDAFRQGPWIEVPWRRVDVDIVVETLNTWQALYLEQSGQSGAGRVYAATGEPLWEAFWRTAAGDCVAYPIARLNTAQRAASSRLLAEACDVYGRAAAAAGHGGSGDDNGDDAREQAMATLRRLVREDVPCFRMLGRMLRRWGMVEAAPVVGRGTGSKLLLMVRSVARAGDVVAVLDGSKVPVVLRAGDADVEAHVAGGSRLGPLPVWYELVCPAYVHGYMDGEALAQVAAGALREQDFVLV